MIKEDKAREWAIKKHQETNHLYDGKPYEIHLQKVTNIAKSFIDLIPEPHRDIVLAACWAHDTIEDTRQTYNDVKKELSEEVAEIVFALTNEKGKTRSQRANFHYYVGIRECLYATFVKLCDRIANVDYSRASKSAMLNIYQFEHADFVDKLFDQRYEIMFVLLEGLTFGNTLYKSNSHDRL